jgi:hypothetical protein
MGDLLAAMARYRVVLVVVLGVAMFLPSLDTGFAVDDWFHLGLIEGAAFMPERGPLELFRFFTEGERDFWPVQGDFLPWWAADDFGASFFRPLTSLSHHLDYRLFGRFAAAHHATSLLWWGLLLVVVMRFFQVLGQYSGRGPVCVLLAGLIYALDDAHLWNVGWLANRNALISVGFAVAALLLYHRHRRHGGLGALLGALAAYVLALCGGESAIALPMWVLAYELCLAQGAPSARLRAAAPVAVVTLLYLLWWSHAGYGASGSDLYISPFDRPLDFARLAVSERIPLLIMGALWPIPAEIAALGNPEYIAEYRVAAWICSGLAIAALWPLCRRDRVCRFLALSALLSLVPMAGTFSHNRLLLLPTVATSWLLASYLVDWAALGRGDAAAGRAWWRRRGSAVVVFVVAVHLLGAPMGAIFGQEVFGLYAERAYTNSVNAAVPTGPEVADSRLIMLNSEDPTAPTYLGLMRWAAGYPMPEAAWSISIVPGDQVMVRTGENRFTLEAGAPGFLTTVWERLFRSDLRVEEGEEFVRGVLKVRARRVIDGQLRIIEVQTERSLDDPRTVLLAWDGERIARMRPPAIGECRRLPLDGYALGIPASAHSPLPDLCADDASFYPVGEVPDPSPRAGEPDAPPSPPSPSPPSPARGSRPSGPCTLEVWTGGAWSPRAQLQCPRDGRLKLLSVGDVGRAGSILDMSIGQMQRACEGDSCQLLLMAGDLIYAAGAQASETWTAVWDQGLARLKLPALAVLGNHAYRHEPGPETRREVLFAADGRSGLVLPAAHYAARLRAGDDVLLAIAALDTDSLSLPGPDKPGLGMEALAEACAQGAPVIALGHHPPSSQGRHVTHEAALQKQIRDVLRGVTAGGCNLVAFVAGHDHDLQAYSPGCEQEGMPAVVVSGVVARGYRGPGSEHLRACPREGAESSYHAGPRPGGGFAILELDTRLGHARAELIDVPEPGRTTLLGAVQWQFPAAKGSEDGVRQSR